MMGNSKWIHTYVKLYTIGLLLIVIAATSPVVKSRNGTTPIATTSSALIPQISTLVASSLTETSTSTNMAANTKSATVHSTFSVSNEEVVPAPTKTAVISAASSKAVSTSSSSTAGEYTTLTITLAAAVAKMPAVSEVLASRSSTPIARSDAPPTTTLAATVLKMPAVSKILLPTISTSIARGNSALSSATTIQKITAAPLKFTSTPLTSLATTVLKIPAVSSIVPESSTYMAGGDIVTKVPTKLAAPKTFSKVPAKLAVPKTVTKIPAAPSAVVSASSTSVAKSKAASTTTLMTTGMKIQASSKIIVTSSTSIATPTSTSVTTFVTTSSNFIAGENNASKATSTTTVVEILAKSATVVSTSSTPIPTAVNLDTTAAKKAAAFPTAESVYSASIAAGIPAQKRTYPTPAPAEGSEPETAPEVIQAVELAATTKPTASSIVASSSASPEGVTQKPRTSSSTRVLPSLKAIPTNSSKRILKTSGDPQASAKSFRAVTVASTATLPLRLAATSSTYIAGVVQALTPAVTASRAVPTTSSSANAGSLSSAPTLANAARASSEASSKAASTFNVPPVSTTPAPKINLSSRLLSSMNGIPTTSLKKTTIIRRATSSKPTPTKTTKIMQINTLTGAAVKVKTWTGLQEAMMLVIIFMICT